MEDLGINPNYVSPEVILDIFEKDLEIPTADYQFRANVFEGDVTLEPDLLDLIQVQNDGHTKDIYTQSWAMQIGRRTYVVVGMCLKFFSNKTANDSFKQSSDLYDFAIKVMERVGFKNVSPYFNQDDYHFAEREINGQTQSFFVYVAEDLAY